MAKIRPVLKDDKLQFRLAVAYHVDREPMLLGTIEVRTFMLSVYLLAYRYVKRDDEEAWLLGQRILVPRTTSEEEQMAQLTALAYKTALHFGRDYTVLVDASPKKPTKEK